MSTVIKDTANDYGPHTLEVEGDDVVLEAVRSFGAVQVTASVPRADFLAAVAAECNVIIIDKADLPDVHRGPGGEGFKVGGLTRFSDSDDAAVAREAARSWLALAEYLDANPPVDEAQVEAVFQALADADPAIVGGWLSDDGVRQIARGMVMRGVRAVTP